MGLDEKIDKRVESFDVILNEDCTQIKEIMDKPNDEILGNSDTIMKLKELIEEIKTISYAKFILVNKIKSKEE